MTCCGCWSNPTTKDAYRLSWASIFVEILAAMGGIFLYRDLDSSLALVFGLENCIDFLSSLVVLWRFFAPFSCDVATEQRLHRREQRASMAISILLVLLGIFIGSAAIADFLRGGPEEPNDLLGAYVMSLISLPLFGTLSVFKFRYANHLDSASLYKDGICSLIGTCLAAALLVNTILIAVASEAWWVDPLIALVAGIMAIGLGVAALYEACLQDKIPIWSIQWWLLSQGDENDNNGTNEMSGRRAGTRRERVEMSPATRGRNSNNHMKQDTTSEDVSESEDVEDVDII